MKVYILMQSIYKRNGNTLTQTEVSNGKTTTYVREIKGDELLLVRSTKYCNKLKWLFNIIKIVLQIITRLSLAMASSPRGFTRKCNSRSKIYISRALLHLACNF